MSKDILGLSLKIKPLLVVQPAAAKCLIGAIVGVFIGLLAKALIFKARPEV